MPLTHEEPQPPSIIYIVVSNLLLKFRNCTNHTQVAMRVSSSLKVADAALCSLHVLSTVVHLSFKNIVNLVYGHKLTDIYTRFAMQSR